MFSYNVNCLVLNKAFWVHMYEGEFMHIIVFLLFVALLDPFDPYSPFKVLIFYSSCSIPCNHEGCPP